MGLGYLTDTELISYKHNTNNIGSSNRKNNDFGANATKKKGLPKTRSPFYLLLDTVDICNKNIFSNIFSTCTVNRSVNIKKTRSNHGLENTNRTQHSSRGGFSSPTCTDTSEISQIVLPRASDGEAACQ